MSVLADAIRSALSIELGLSHQGLDIETRFEDVGLDAVTIIATLDTVYRETGVDLPATLFRDCACLLDLLKRIDAQSDNGNLLPFQVDRHGRWRAKIDGQSSGPRGSPSKVREAYAESCRCVDRFAVESGLSDFWTKVYPSQRRLVLAYVVEAFQLLHSPLERAPPGSPVSIPHKILPKHHKLFDALFDVLADGGYVECRGGELLRTSVAIDPRSSAALLREMLDKSPQHMDTHLLLAITGPQLAECVTGAADPIKLLFGSSIGRRLLKEFYTNAPMSIAASKQLTHFLVRALSGFQECVEILEIGAGFGGTTTFVLDSLVKAGIPFKYTFTDISPSFFKAAKNRYESLAMPHGSVEYEILDIEKPPPEKLRGRFHAVLSTNCIHATKDLAASCANARKLLRRGGFFGLVEFSIRLYWLDLVFGLLDGWWLFQDGRRHCIVDEEHWKANLEAAGFRDVAWTAELVDGKRPNPQLIVAMTE